MGIKTMSRLFRPTLRLTKLKLRLNSPILNLIKRSDVFPSRALFKTYTLIRCYLPCSSSSDLWGWPGLIQRCLVINRSAFLRPRIFQRIVQEDTMPVFLPAWIWATAFCFYYYKWKQFCPRSSYSLWHSPNPKRFCKGDAMILAITRLPVWTKSNYQGRCDLWHSNSSL